MEEQDKYELKSNINAKKTLVSGTSWRGFAELFRIGWSAVVVVILASMLGPIAFGLVGMTDALVQFFNIFMAMGFDAAIIQQEKMNDKILSSLFWLNLVLGILLAVIGVAISPLLAWFYQEEKVEAIFPVLCLTFIFQSFSVVQRGLLGREMAFRSLAIVDMVATFLASMLAIIMAIQSGSYWSLVVLQLGKHAITAIGYWFSSSWRPQFVFDLNTSMLSVRFSGNVLLFNVLNFFATRSDIILVGRLLGAEQAGFYLLANHLIMRPVGQILNVVTHTLYPILSAMKNNIARVRETYIKVIVALFSLMAPAILLFGIVGVVLIPYLLGPEWATLVPIFIIWCFGAMQRIVTSRLGVLYLSMNRPDLQWKYQLISTPIVIAALFIGVQFGALGASFSYNLAQFATSFISMYLAFSLINLTIVNYFKHFKFSAISLFCELLLGVGLMFGLASFSLHPIIMTGIVAIISLGGYALVFYLIDPQMRQLWIDGRSWLSKRALRLGNLS